MGLDTDAALKSAKAQDSCFAPKCISLDLEIAKNNSSICKIGAVRGDTGESFLHPVNNRKSERKLAEALNRLDEFAAGAAFVLGHNIIEFDLPHLRAAAPTLQLLRLPVIDTLRLSPLARPAHPYHNLVKHYKDGGIRRRSLNDPELDARLVLELFESQFEDLGKSDPDLLKAWHWLCIDGNSESDRVLNRLFEKLRGKKRPGKSEALAAIGSRLEDNGCIHSAVDVIRDASGLGWSLAYGLAWLSVAGGNSVIPPWVRHQFPETCSIIRKLRDTACTDPKCGWCRTVHDAKHELKQWFNYSEFRPEPACGDGKSMQQAITEEAFAGRHVLGILPTGTGKSICYQLPALSRDRKTGALTVVISPLVALMRDQVAGLKQRGIESCVTVNGLLSMPERSDALEQLRLGDASMLLISPEQLRSRTLLRALDQREIGAWVLDEAHCISQWGHDFRPDYRYVCRFIKKKAGKGPIPPVMCLTATAKPDVIDEICQQFNSVLGIEFTVFNGGVERSNLDFSVMPTAGGHKFGSILQIMQSKLNDSEGGGVIIYCATRRSTEEVAQYLATNGVKAEHFHAGLQPEAKKDVQQRFISGELTAIAATNAFGMGIDKPDVRLVIHSDTPSSLEHYMQEAGRAGRDQKPAFCVLMHSDEDVERQFRLSSRSRLNRREIHGVLRAMRSLRTKKRQGDCLIATSGEILGEDEEQAFERDSATDDTRVRTAVAWLEEARLLKREENVVQLFPSSLKVATLQDAKKKLAGQNIAETYQTQLLNIVGKLIEADKDEGVSTDELMANTKLSSEEVRKALYDLEGFGIASNDTVLTAFVHAGVRNASQKRLQDAAELEKALIAHLRECAPDLDVGGQSQLHLRLASQQLKDQGLRNPLPDRIWSIVRGISRDGRGEGGASGGSMRIRKLNSETGRINLLRNWRDLEKTAARRRSAAQVLLNHLLSCLAEGQRGTDLLAETTLGKLLDAVKSDIAIRSEAKDPEKLMERALLWLHEQEIVRLNRGLAVFRAAMTIRLEEPFARGFANADFKPLELHYKGQVMQTHIVKEYAEHGLKDMREAVRLADDYFKLSEGPFLEHWLQGRSREIVRPTTPQSWRNIVENGTSPEQRRIIADDREQTNVLVLAGPGSGKTRVLVHRIAYLVRVKRENPKGILALAYNRHAAVQIRRRLTELIGDDAKGVAVYTCDGLAMRLAGASFNGIKDRPDNDRFAEVMDQATALLRGKDLLPDEADERRERLLAGFRWILIDEYQDIDRRKYELLSALAGRTLDDDQKKLNLFAVGDDDQSIYGFNGASVEYIHAFERDYPSKATYLTANYRSAARIIEAGNKVIESADGRMKAEHPIHIDKDRNELPPGGDWEAIDPVAKGRVQIIPAGKKKISQAVAAVEELSRLQELDPSGWNWSRCAVISREWKYLEPVRSYCEAKSIEYQMGNEANINLWHLRETSNFIGWLRGYKSRTIKIAEIINWIGKQQSNQWNQLLTEAMEEFQLEFSEQEVSQDHLAEWLAEWGHDMRRRQTGLLLLTAHRSKGLEFDHVAVLDGGWNRRRKNSDGDDERRLYYVAMTRARKTLALMELAKKNPFLGELSQLPSVLNRDPALPASIPADLANLYVHSSLADVDLGYAGRSQDRKVHSAISRLQPGDPLVPSQFGEGKWELRNWQGQIVGKMSQKFRLPEGLRVKSAKVMAIIRRRRDQSDPEHVKMIKREEWEVAVPEFILMPSD